MPVAPYSFPAPQNRKNVLHCQSAGLMAIGLLALYLHIQEKVSTAWIVRVMPGSRDAMLWFAHPQSPKMRRTFGGSVADIPLALLGLLFSHINNHLRTKNKPLNAPISQQIQFSKNVENAPPFSCRTVAPIPLVSFSLEYIGIPEYSCPMIKPGDARMEIEESIFLVCTTDTDRFTTPEALQILLGVGLSFCSSLQQNIYSMISMKEIGLGML